MRNSFILSVGLIFVAGLVLSVSGCGGRGTGKLELPEREVTPVDPSQTGSIGGTAHCLVMVAQPRVIKVAGNPECSALTHGRIRSEEILVQDGHLANVFVYVKSGLEGKVFAVPTDPVQIDNRGCVYIPHVAGAQAYQPVLLMNSDPTLHNIHVMTQNSRPMNIGLPVQGMSRTIQFPAEEVMVKMKCDVHPWMGAYLGVVDHPFFAVTGSDGVYSLEGVPAGTYTVAAWHESLGSVEKEITITPNGEVVLDFEFGK